MSSSMDSGVVELPYLHNKHSFSSCFSNFTDSSSKHRCEASEYNVQARSIRTQEAASAACVHHKKPLTYCTSCIIM